MDRVNPPAYLETRIPEGQRNEALFKTLCAARRDGWSESDLNALVDKAVRVDGLPASEAKAALASAMRQDCPPKPRSSVQRIGWNDPIFVDDAPQPHAPVPFIPPPRPSWETDDLPEFVRTLFEPDEFVAYNKDSTIGEDGRPKPKGWGQYKVTAQVLLDRCATMTATQAVGAKEHGVWCRLNPTDGEGIKDSNVTAYRHVLVECDDIPIEQQWRLVNDLKLPVATAVHSGHRSIHFAVRIEALDKDEYRRRTTILFDLLKKHGLEAKAAANRNPSRLSRLPGVLRDGQPQYLMATNLGYPSWADFEASLSEEEIQEEPIFELVDTSAWSSTEPPAQEYLFANVFPAGILAGIFAQGGIGKGWFTETLVISACLRRTLFKSFVPARPLRVLWVESEDTTEELHRRFNRICKAYTLDSVTTAVMQANLRLVAGKAFPLVQTMSRTVVPGKAYAPMHKLCEEWKPDLIILDPLSHFIAVDENANTEVSAAINLLRQLATASSPQCTLWVNHHTAKRSGDDATSDAGRGATAIRDSLRLVYNLTWLGDSERKEAGIAREEAHLYVKLTNSKANYTERAASDIVFKRDTGETGGVLREIDLDKATRQRKEVRKSKAAIEVAYLLGDNPQNLTVRTILFSSECIALRAEIKATMGLTQRQLKTAVNDAVRRGALRLEQVETDQGIVDVPRCALPPITEGFNDEQEE